jgi:hypothetical protein
LPVPVLQELRPLLRVEELPAATVFLARGGPDSIANLRTAAYRTARRFCLDGELLLGISVAATLDVPLDELVSRAPLLRFEHVYAPTAAQLQGFHLQPTFGRPHFTVWLQRADDPELRELLAALGPLQANPGTVKVPAGMPANALRRVGRCRDVSRGHQRRS